MLLNCGVGEDSWESLGLQGDQPWDFFGRTDAKAETPVLWPPHAKSWLYGKRLWCWEGLGAGGEGDDRGWDGWIASSTQWMWIWVNSRSWWWTGRPGVLRFMGSQRVRHDWATERNWTEGDKWASRVALVVKNPPASAGDADSIPGSGWSPGGGHGNLLQYSCLENPIDRRDWQSTAHRVAKSQTWLKWLSMHARR